jgi:aminopeptidase N
VPTAGPCQHHRSAAPAPGAYDVSHYDAAIEVNPADSSVSGVVQLTLRTCHPSDDSVRLAAGRLTIDEVLLDGVPVRHAVRPPWLVVHLRRERSASEALRLRVRYRGRPARGMRFGPGFVHTGFHTGEWLVSNPDPADKARLASRVRLPAGYGLVAGADSVRRTVLPGGTVEFAWNEGRPFSAYLFGFAAGRFELREEVQDGLRLRHAAIGLSPAEAEQALRATAPAIRFFEWASGARFPGRSYSQALLPGAFPQELAGMAVLDAGYGRSVLADPSEDYLVVHEVAHSWWGNAVTASDWSHFWLNEGITTYMVAAYKEWRWGRAAYEREIALARIRYGRALAQAPRAVIHRGWTTPDEAGGPVTYSGGALFMHLLRSQLGDAAFWRAVRLYTRNGLRSGLADTEALRLAVERSAGRDLRAAFSWWLEAAPPQPLTARHETGPGELRVILEQPARSGIAIRVAVTTDGGRAYHPVRLHERTTVLRIPVSDPVRSVRVDADYVLPLPVRHDRPAGMLRHQLAHEPDVPGRADALIALTEPCGTAAPSAECDEVERSVREVASRDRSQVVRQLAERWIAGRAAR